MYVLVTKLRTEIRVQRLHAEMQINALKFSTCGLASILETMTILMMCCTGLEHDMIKTFHSHKAFVVKDSLETSALLTLQTTFSSRKDTFLLCCSMCYDSHGCGAAAYRHGISCSLIKATVPGLRLVQGNGTATDYQIFVFNPSIRIFVGEYAEC